MLKFIRLFLLMSLSMLSASLTWSASVCTHKATTLIAETQKITIEECRDISSWPQQKAQKFCPNHQETDTSSSLCEGPLCKCRAGYVATCQYTNKTPKGLPEEYFAQFDPALREEIKKNAAAALAEVNQDLAEYEGLSVMLYYYSSQRVDMQIHQNDCKNKDGEFKTVQAP
jgi:hypothetical protein